MSSLFSFVFCNRSNSFLSFVGPQLYNLEALSFTYDQYVVTELSDNSVTVFICAPPKVYLSHVANGFECGLEVHFNTLIDIQSILLHHKDKASKKCYSLPFALNGITKPSLMWRYFFLCLFFRMPFLSGKQYLFEPQFFKCSSRICPLM